ncbi:MAG: MarR family transcriptional regulator [Ramlibacter sp.]|jgi:DNA-binding MarR family transcriptional regulator|uniref:MarR family winged helix-turn-helix transcriptional regulator n=1 Tax=Ramlibacter sp. TaxID=1917967 RepID=UPI0026036A00|nr:MarR family transcriptional regulator [Ramlibacter sp.]MDH4377443.1 MarR family transcriptional regulator [Ramlibacter sp.]
MKAKSKNLDPCSLPGHLARRVQQLAVALFAQEVGDIGLTPVQYSALQTVCNQPGIDQKTLAATIGYDTSTIAGVIDRLEARGLLARQVSPVDRRAKLLTPTEEGTRTLAAVVPRMLQAQERLLEPLAAAERKEFMRMMRVVIEANAELSTIPARD